MYDPLSEVYMIQQMNERKAGGRSSRQEVAARAGRRWWRRAARTAR